MTVMDRTTECGDSTFDSIQALAGIEMLDSDTLLSFAEAKRA